MVGELPLSQVGPVVASHSTTMYALVWLAIVTGGPGPL